MTISRAEDPLDHRGLNNGRPTPNQRGLVPPPSSVDWDRYYNRPASTCPAIWDQPAFWVPLLAWIRSREGARQRFYRDSRGFVTIGFGDLADRPHGTAAQRQAAGHAFAASRFGLFRTATGGGVTAAQVYADWLDVYNHTRTTGFLVLPAAAIEQMLQEKTRGFAVRMYTSRSHSRCLPGRLQMALIDTAFNPGRHNNLFIPRPANHIISRMWAALDRSQSLGNPRRNTPEDIYNPQYALELFNQRWGIITNPPSYPNRHAWRLARFQEGVNTMIAEDRQQFSSALADL